MYTIFLTFKEINKTVHLVDHSRQIITKPAFGILFFCSQRYFHITNSDPIEIQHPKIICMFVVYSSSDNENNISTIMDTIIAYSLTCQVFVYQINQFHPIIKINTIILGNRQPLQHHQIDRDSNSNITIFSLKNVFSILTLNI